MYQGRADATLARVNQAGGSAPAEGQDWPGVGRMAIAHDPTGAVFGVISPAAGGAADAD